MIRFDIMDKTDRLLFNFLFGLVLPLLGFEVAIWFAFEISSAEKAIATAALIGFSIGLAVSLLIWFIFKPDIYKLPVLMLILIYLFYNICIFGFFMGVPVFNLVAGALAGYYWVKRILNRNELDNSGRDVRRLSIFTSSITAIICVASAIIALLSKSTPEDLRGMFHLHFEITRPLLVSIIIIGGIMLVTLQYYLTRFVMEKTLKASTPKS
jgi:ABC-type Fe3+ transport system permease subunit